jgi:transposase
MKRSRGPYAAAGTPTEVKEYRARLALALRQRGVSLDTFLEANEETGFSVSRRTLFEHVAALDAGRSPLSAEKGSGRPAKLMDEQWAVVAGAILLEERKTDLQWVITWIQANFGVTLTFSTVSKHLDELDLCFRLTSGRPMPKSMTDEAYVIQYYECVKKLHDEAFFDWNPKKIVAVDCCTNSRRLERDKTISIKGAKQKKKSASKPLYTNTYVVAVCLEDVGQYPALMFTHDPTFNPVGPRAKEVVKWCKEMSIDRDRIVYSEGAKKYSFETCDMIAHFKNVYRKELSGTRVMHDGGGSFKFNGEYILADGADRHFVLPAATHGELSPLDNKVNAIAKNQWRTERKGDDFSYDDLYLLWCFDWVKPASIKSFWVQNFMLNEKKLSLVTTADRLRGKDFSRREILEKYIADYESWCLDRGEPVSEGAFEALDSKLDGSYWTK